MIGHWTSHRLGAETGSATPGVTVYEFDSGTAGPTVLVLGGVHGNEVGGIVAAGRLVGADLGLHSGRIMVVPRTHEAAFDADSRTSPHDGLNLARVFPGNPDGSPTEIIAALVSSKLIALADVLIDLHTSSPETDMPLFCGCLDDGSPSSTRSVELALAFGAPQLWTHATLGPGRTLGVARDRGIPAIYVESPGGGTLAEALLDAYGRGVLGVLGELGMRDPVPAKAPTLWLHGDGDLDAFAHAGQDGLFLAEVELLKRVLHGDLIGSVIDPLGRMLEPVYAQDDGYVSTLRKSSRVEAGTTLVGIIPARPSILGLPSDAFAAARTGRDDKR